MATTRTPKKGKKPTRHASSTKSSGVISINPKTNAQSPAFPLVAFLWPAKKSTSQWVLLPLILMVVGLFRWAVGFWGYSGFQKPPMHGDFEAQRHWMEITTHLPASKWYFYDLQYWGLDYPPLTAYHSWVLGKIGSVIDPTWFALDISRGIETPLLKVYMRATVLVSEYLIYMPAVIVLNRRLGQLQGINAWEGSIALVAILMQPATILIDHAHFQYNTVMLGFVLASMSTIFAGGYLWGCVFFVAALSFKQMALYYAPAVFAYLIGVCLLPQPSSLRLFSMAFITIISFALVFAPLLLKSLYETTQRPSLLKELEIPSLFTSLPLTIDTKALYYGPALQLTQVIHRIFPFARGIFEDKVANFWCALNVLLKLQNHPTPILQRLSLCATIIAILPACMLISLFPQKHLLPWSLASTAWGFFLCSFQVHEKSVLLPLLPMTLLLGTDGGLDSEFRPWIGWANTLAVWTLFPLLKRDELRVPYTVLSLLWTYLLGLPPASFHLYTPKAKGLSTPIKFLHLAFYAAMGIWHLCEAFVDPPPSKPDLWVVLNVLIGASGFGICWLWCTWQLILRSGVMEEYFGIRLRLEAEGKVKLEKANETKETGTGKGKGKDGSVALRRSTRESRTPTPAPESKPHSSPTKGKKSR